MTNTAMLILGSYSLVILLLLTYCMHRYYLIYLYFRHKKYQPQSGALLPLPSVTVQLPIYNEMFVVDRLVETICQLDYPRELLEIQVLDDSTDETRYIAECAVRRFAAHGVNLKYYHRNHRIGYKAGALQAGLAVSKGQYIAIFDADFLPLPDFLHRLLPYFVDSTVGMVQARWAHLNADHSLLTRIQSIMLDGHFVIEHGGRNRSGRFFNFSGTAGIWRREAIDTAGGWQHDTVTEDLDLSYRAQLKGWRFVFLPHVIAPAELPAEINDFKSQQRRWAKGNIQTCRKLLLRVMCAKISLARKVEAFFHLTAHLNSPLALILSLLMFPFLYERLQIPWINWYGALLMDLLLFSASTLSFFTFYAVSQRELHHDWTQCLKYLPLLLAVGIGLSVNNARGFFEAITGKANEFDRTPKYGSNGFTNSNEWIKKRYHRPTSIQPLIELTVGVYLTATIVYAFVEKTYTALPYLVLFQVGYLYTGSSSILQEYAGRRKAMGARRARKLDVERGEPDRGSPLDRRLVSDLHHPPSTFQSDFHC
jgi:cellulose synthase/poly-beta-1,6-N-acetylglucosamine synthase-like glycosyltransferase